MEKGYIIMIVSRRNWKAATKATFAVLGSLALAATTATAQVLPPEDGNAKDENWNTFGAEAGPKLDLTIKAIELGLISDNEKVPSKIAFTNSGTGLLTIERINTSCGCTAADLSTKDYLPGESGEIDITYDPTGRAGKQRKVITIISNDRDQRMTQVVLTVEIDPIIEVGTPVVSAKNVVFGEGAEARVTFKCDWKEFEVKAVTIAGSSVEAVVEKEEVVKLADGREEHQITVLIKISPEAPIGYVRRTLDMLAVIGDGESAPFEQAASATINVNVVGDIQSTPSRISFGRLNAGGEYERRLTIKSRRGKPFKIESVEFDRPIPGESELSIESVELDADGLSATYSIVLKGKAPAKPGIINGSIRIRTNVAEQAEMKIAVVGSVARPRR